MCSKESGIENSKTFIKITAEGIEQRYESRRLIVKFEKMGS